MNVWGGPKTVNLRTAPVLLPLLYFASSLSYGACFGVIRWERSGALFFLSSGFFLLLSSTFVIFLSPICYDSPSFPYSVILFSPPSLCSVGIVMQRFMTKYTSALRFVWLGDSRRVSSDVIRGGDSRPGYEATTQSAKNEVCMLRGCPWPDLGISTAVRSWWPELRGFVIHRVGPNRNPPLACLFSFTPSPQPALLDPRRRVSRHIASCLITR